MAVDPDRFLEVFLVESFDALDNMERSLLRLAPGAADIDTINTIFRVAHSIKGGAGMLGFDQMVSYTHALESLLDELRAGRTQVTPSICEGLLQSVDQLRGMLNQAADSTPVVPHAAAEAPLAATAAGLRNWEIAFKPLPALLSRGNDPLRMFAELLEMGELKVVADAATLPALPIMDTETCYISWRLSLATAAPRCAIEQVFDWAEGDCELQIQLLDTADPAPASGTPAAASAPARHGATMPAGIGPEVSTIRIANEKLDELLHAVGEALITQSMLNQLSQQFHGTHADRLRTGLAQLDSIVRDLRRSVLRMRMLPVGSVFSRFPRLVRDLSTRLGKNIRLQISGENTELDKTVLERIGDPLVHLVRNSVDHGIESPQVRVAAGKAEEGTVHLHACHKGGSLNIAITDDGGGLDKRRIIEKALSKGLIDAHAQLSEEQIFDLIFLPGFSTAAQITDLSGRGVGMDVVRQNIEDLGGRVEVVSELGIGTTITIILPLTPAVVDDQRTSMGEETCIAQGLLREHRETA